MSGHHCIEIKPVKSHASQKEIKAAIQPSTVLEKATETEIEIAAIKSKLGWKHPIGLFGYSKDSKYKDLWIYFDLKDQSSPLNEVANRTFYMYGLDGAQCEPDWTIRGSVLVIRIEPDYNFSPDAKFVPLISTEEMYDTIVFFRDCKDSPRKIALKRDSVRMMGSFAMNPPTAAGGMNMNAFMDTNGFYMGTGLRSLDKVKQDADVCDACGKSQSLLSEKLKKCQACKVTFYCSKACQKKAWKAHKKVCADLCSE